MKSLEASAFPEPLAGQAAARPLPENNGIAEFFAPLEPEYWRLGSMFVHFCKLLTLLMSSAVQDAVVKFANCIFTNAQSIAITLDQPL